MPIELTKEQQKQLDSLQENPLQIVDPRTNLSYVLVSEKEYDHIREILEEEKNLQVIHRIALSNAIKRMNAEP